MKTYFNSSQITRGNFRIHSEIVLLSFLVCCFLLSSCAVNPATGSADFVLMSESQELKIGKELHEKIIESSPIYPDKELQEYVDGIGQRVAKTSDRPELTYTFTIIDSPDINAFALPGGYIYINRGLINYLQTEAQLAAVLSHEIAHVTARHAVRRDARQKGSGFGTGFLSILSVIATGYTVVGDVASLYSTEAVLGYGRELELEADKFGAEYLFNSNYDPQAMVEVISVLKDQERFTRLKAKDQGKKPQAYHGVFSSHPRNDQRLREIVSEAGAFDSANTEINSAEFRKKTEGLVFGINYDAPPPSKKDIEPNRYIHTGLGFTLLFPEGWTFTSEKNAITGQPDNGNAQLQLTVSTLRKNISPRDYIRDALGIPLLTKSEAFNQFGLIGHTGIKPAEKGGQPERIAVLFQANRVYIFSGTIKKVEKDVDFDSLFLASIRSFQPVRVNNTTALKTKTIHYVRANNNTTFAALARLSSIRPYPEEELRLLNGYYPRGEPKPGEWIKIVQ
ncbi:M48 family metalloprotease [Aurantivibrio infirmus]